MDRVLKAIAFACVLIAPTAFAQSNVTISGFLKGGFEGAKLGHSVRANNSQSGVVDDASRIIFNVAEDLGNGLQAIGQVDVRIKLDDTQGVPAAVGGSIPSGNTHVGLRSKDWGRIFIGRQDLHYFNRESDLTTRGSLRADSISILAYAGGGGQPIASGIFVAGASRTQNVVHYTTPNWGGFTLIAAYSSNPFGTEADIGSGIRKGRAWNLNPNFAGANWQIGYSYWTSKNDAAGTAIFPLTVGLANGDQRGDRLYGSYTWGGFKVGFAWDKSLIKVAVSGVELSNRTAWSIPVSYRWGSHSLSAHIDKAQADKAGIFAGGDTRASMFAMSYAYDLSRRTSAAVTYARINNGAAATYNFFTGASLGVSPATVAGEDPRLWAFTLRHAF